MDLQAFLYPIQEKETAFVVSPRFQDEQGPAAWKIRTLTAEEDEQLRRVCTKLVPVPGQAGQFMPELDYHLYAGKLAAACTVFPDLQLQALQDAYHVLGADALLKAMLKPGEYLAYIQKIQEVNGFHISMDDLVDQAKN